MRIAAVELLEVRYHAREAEPVTVGRLARRARELLFEYDDSFIARGLSLSPLRIPLSRGVMTGDPLMFDGLLGLFDDSLPDGWGRLLLDRRLAELGLRPTALGPLDRLAWVGDQAIGALSYHPQHARSTPTMVDLRRLERETARVLVGEVADLEQLIAIGGSPQGARPKALVQVSGDGRSVIVGAQAPQPGYEPYLVKFRARRDEVHAPEVELAYMLMARAAGIEVPECRLLGRTTRRPGYFASRRFDRTSVGRVHVHTLCGLIHAPHTHTALSYRELLLVTRKLTASEVAVAEMFRRACFNVFAHNRDDHTKNFAFLMDERGRWRPSPAYDLTYSDGPGGEHTLLVDGEGRAPTRAHLEALARSVSLRKAGPIIDAVEAAVRAVRAHGEEAGLPRRAREALATSLGV